MNTAANISSKNIKNNIEPVLRKVLKDAQQEYQQLQQMFKLMGWSDLPDALKAEIKNDVSAMVNELTGHYSSCDPHVERRRRRVVYWVETFRQGICSKQTAIDALRVRSL